MLAGEFGEASVVPLVVSTAKAGGTVAVDGAPGEGVGAPVVGCFGEAGVAAAEPEVLTARGEAGGKCAGDSWRTVEIGQHA